MHPTILVVDDDDELREALCVFFRTNGYAVHEARSGDEAMEALLAGLRPCIILLDVLMPDKNGFMFRANQQSNLPEIEGVPLIAHSGVRDLAEYAKQLQARAFIQKPAKLDDILAVVREHCLK